MYPTVAQSDASPSAILGCQRAADVNQSSASPRKAMLWFSGPAGGGKTSIMRGMIDRCAATGFSTLSFFFSVRGSGVTNVHPFVATITRRLAVLDTVLKPIIYNAIQSRPTIFEEFLEEQIARVLIEPLQSPTVQSQSAPPRIVIAIDGLEECRKERERQQLLDILHSLVTKLPRLVVVIIASRPEFDLRRAFDDPKLSDITESIKLHNYNGSNDIRVFVPNEIEAIRKSHPLRGSIPEGWQPEEIIQLLVDKSSGNFIIPATAMKYIRNSRQNPIDSLNIVLGVLKNPLSNSKPFAELDALYALVLHPPEANPSLIRRILHCIIGVTALGHADRLLSSFIDALLELPPGTTATALCDLHSILHIPESKYDAIKSHHKSLEDFLLDRERSLDFFQSPYKTHLDLTVQCATHISRWGSNPIVDDSDHIAYSALYWHSHLKSCTDQKPVSATLPDIVMDLDPRHAVMYRYTHEWFLFTISNNIAQALHASLCSGRHCVRLCEPVARVNNCSNKCLVSAGNFSMQGVEQRYNALSRFKSETGLFAPLDPDSRAVFGDKNENSPLEDEDEDGLLDGLLDDERDDEFRDGGLDDKDGHGQADDDVTANTMGGTVGCSGGSAIAAGDSSDHSKHSAPRGELSRADAGPSALPMPAPSAPPNLVPRSTRRHRFVAWIRRSFGIRS